MRVDPHFFASATYDREAATLQKRVDTRRSAGIVVTSDQLWAWIKERHPAWHELNWEQVYKRVKL